MKQMKNNVLLVLTALIWGCSFVAQSVGMDYVGPFTFNAVRCLIGAAVLIPVILFMDKSARKSGLTDEEMKSRRGDTKTLVTRRYLLRTWPLVLRAACSSGASCLQR